MEEYIGTKIASEILGLKQSTLAKMCREKQISSAEQDKIGSPWRMLKSEIEQIKREGVK